MKHPKDKAKELVEKLYSVTDDEFCIGYNMSKQCAIIAVDEIIQTLNNDIKDIDVVGSVLLDLIEYWRNVKREINNL